MRLSARCRWCAARRSETQCEPIVGTLRVSYVWAIWNPGCRTAEDVFITIGLMSVRTSLISSEIVPVERHTQVVETHRVSFPICVIVVV